MRVIGLHLADSDEPTGCEIYRVNMPLVFLGAGGRHQAIYKRKSELKEVYAKTGQSLFAEIARNFDVVVLPRLTSGQGIALQGIAAFIRLIRGFGARAVYEIDDDFSNKHRDLTAMGISDAMTIASWCDAITVTTPYLADMMRKETQRPTYVLPNMLAPDLWRRPEHRIESPYLTIGLTGSVTHEADWKVLETVLPRILDNTYDVEVRLVLMGFHPDYLSNLPRTAYLPGFDFGTYAEVIRSCDIILAPVVPDDPFNLCKSPIKVIEGMGASRPVGSGIGGAACIATDNPVYRLAIEHNKTGLLVSHTPEGWYEAIDGLLRNEAKRHQIQVAGHTWTWNHHDISRTWTSWASAYQRIIAKPSNTLALPYAS